MVVVVEVLLVVAVVVEVLLVIAVVVENVILVVLDGALEVAVATERALRNVEEIVVALFKMVEFEALILGEKLLWLGVISISALEIEDELASNLLLDPASTTVTDVSSTILSELDFSSIGTRFFPG